MAILLVETLQEVNMTVVLKQTDNEDLESKIPIDRVIEVKFGITSLADTEFIITNDMIERIIDGSNE